MIDSNACEHILLETEQTDLLLQLVEADRSIPREQRQKFLVSETTHGEFLKHPGVPDAQSKVYLGDLEILGRENLISLRRDRSTLLMFDVTPLGFEYYRFVKRKTGQPAERIERPVRSYLDSAAFRQAYGAAFTKWTQAEDILWGADSTQQLTTIGHLCRESLQEFAAILVDRYQPPDAPRDKAAVTSRIRHVLEKRKANLGTTEGCLLDALLAYWEKVVDLAQRQEHGGQREGKPLVWEDARRLVFQTAILMFECDRSLARQ